MTAARPTVDATDLFHLREDLSDEERLVAESTRRFVRERVLPAIAEHFEAGTFLVEIATEIGELGLFGMHLDGYGCAGINATSYGLAWLELEAGDSGLRSFGSVQGSLEMSPIWRYGSEEHKERWLPPMARGEAIGCFGLTEPDQGSDPSGMRTNAKRDGSAWVINGSKLWITNGGVADVAVVWAQTDGGLLGFVVPTDTPGFEARDVPPKLSLRASVTCELVMTDVRLPENAVLPDMGGLKGPLSCLNEARFGILWGAIGAARAWPEAALEYAGTREQFGSRSPGSSSRSASSPR